MALNYDETTFLCGYQRTRRYGSTVSINSTSVPSPRYRLLRYEVQPIDTIPALALKYNSNVTEIKRINKLWSNESLHLKSWINIPVIDNDQLSTDSPTSSNTATIECYPTQSSSTNSQPVESLNDLFKRIDLTIKTTAKNVKRLERESTVVNDDTTDNESLFRRQTSLNCQHPSPRQLLKSKQRNARGSLDRLQQNHDHFYQL